jgi:hypothetical protein
MLGGAAVALASLLCACFGLRSLGDAPPNAYSLSGTWKLNKDKSSDTSQALKHLHVKPQRQYGPGTQGPDPTNPEADLYQQILALPPDITVQTSVLRGGDWLRIEQHPEEIVISNGDSVHSYGYGRKSVVSVPSGVADQVSGWSGKEFIVEIKPQLGPRIQERYKLSPDGKQLIATVHIDSEGRVPSVALTRVYDQSEGAPGALPAGD